MPGAKVSIAKVSDYGAESLSRGLQKCLELIGGIEALIKPQSRVFVKINHLSPPSPPERAIITHPSLAREVILLLKNMRCEVTVGDDIQPRREDGYLLSGYRKVCEELKVRLLNLKETGFREVRLQGQALNRAYIASPVLDSDFIINLPKLKTHSFMAFTGAVKNMFGTIPGGLRLRYHRQFDLPDLFGQMLVDVFTCSAPHLTIMDAVVAMEGEGPSAGRPRKVGLLLASQDAVALDSIASKIAGLKPLDIYTTLHAQERNLGEADLERVEIRGGDITEFEVQDFKHSATAIGLFRRRLPQFLYARLQAQLALIPEVKRPECTGCVECLRICPSGAVKWIGGKAWIDENLCINCLCCHEVCRYNSIELRQKPVARGVRAAHSIYKSLRSLLEKKLKENI